MKTLTLLLMLILLSQASTAQEDPDSLKALLRTAIGQHDTARLNYYTAYLGYIYYSKGNYDSAIAYYYKQLNSAGTDSATLATTLNGIGGSYYQLDFPDSSLLYYDRALALFRNLNDTAKAIDVESNIIQIYTDLGLYEKALEKSFDLITRLEKQDASRALGSCYSTTASIFEATGEYRDALVYHRRSLSVRLKINNEKGVAHAFNNIGETFSRIGQYDSAITNLKKSLIIKEKLGDKLGSAHSLNSLGNVYSKLGSPKEAETYFNKALQLRREVKDKTGQAISLNSLGELKLTSKLFREATILLDEAEQLSRETHAIETLKQNLTLKLKLYGTMGMHSHAINVARELMSLKDSLINVEKSKNLKSIHIGFETVKKENRILLLEQSEELKQAEIHAKQIVIYALIVGLLLVLVIAVLIYRNFNNARKSKERVETLLKELHHRVKNNLQILSSVLTLHAEQLTDKSAQHAMKSSEGRVNAMALIHRKLYNAEQNRSVDLKGYVAELIEYLMSSYGYVGKQIKIKINIPPLQIDIDKAIPLGLILNELVTNAFKYAFSNHNAPQLDIVVTPTRNEITIHVIDNGKGLDSQAIGSDTGSFGIKLTTTLIRQLKGNYTLKSELGTHYTLNIPI
jgi:two-component sensor histidine kinase